MGKGWAQALQGMGARVLVTEIDPICALQAAMEGFEVVRMDDAAAIGDIFITATGCLHVIDRKHMDAMKNQAIVANIGHFDTEINVASLISDETLKRINIKPQVDQFVWPDGKRIPPLAEGRLVNRGCATGRPSFVLSTSSTNPVLAQLKLYKKDSNYENKVYVLPKHLDEKVAALHLDQLGAKLTKLRPEQAAYIGVEVDGPFKSDTYRY